MRLSTASCAVREDSCIVAVQNLIEQWLCSGSIDVALCGMFIKDSIKSKCLIFGPLALRHTAESLNGILFRGVEDSDRHVSEAIHVV